MTSCPHIAYTDAGVKLCLRIVDEKTGTEVAKSNGQSMIHFGNLGLDGAEEG